MTISSSSLNSFSSNETFTSSKIKTPTLFHRYEIKASWNQAEAPQLGSKKPIRVPLTKRWISVEVLTDVDLPDKQLTTSRMDFTQLLQTARTATHNVERIITKAKTLKRFDILNEGVFLLERVFLHSNKGEFKLNDLIDKSALDQLFQLDFREVKTPLINSIDMMMSFSEQHRYFRNHRLRPSEQ